MVTHVSKKQYSTIGYLDLPEPPPYHTSGSEGKLMTIKPIIATILSIVILVAGCEVSQQEGIQPATLVAAQIAVGMVFFEAALKIDKNIEQKDALDKK